MSELGTPLVDLPRVPLMPAPTPLHHAAGLSAELGVAVWFKRDDLTGFGLGGNKVRALEYLLADARRCGCDSVVTGAGPRSNWAMLAALAARRCGLDPHLVYYGTTKPPTGNHALATEWAYAEIRFTGSDDRTSTDDAIHALADELTRKGRRPYVLPRGGATATGCLGYMSATRELAAQLVGLGLEPEALWLATGSCGTHAGLVAGARLLGARYRVTGVAVSRPVAECAARISLLATECYALLGADSRGQHNDVDVRGGYLGDGYGAVSPAASAAAQLVARTEGVLLDPVFGAKAMAALVDAARHGRLTGPVIFLVTGGAPTLLDRFPT